MRNNAHGFKRWTIALLFLLAICTLTGCFEKKNSYTGQVYSSGKEIVAEAVERIEQKYGMSGGELEVVDYVFQGSGGPLSSSETIAPVYITLQDRFGKEFHAYYYAGDPDSMAYDDYQYEDILGDFQELYEEELAGAERVSIKYSSMGLYVNLLGEDEFYQGDLAEIPLEKVRLEYVDQDIFEKDFSELPYLIISYISEQALEDWSQDNWWNIPLYSAFGVQAMKTEEEYKEYNTVQYGDFYVTADQPVEVEAYDQTFSVDNLIGHGASDPIAVSEAISVKTEGNYNVYYKAEQALAMLEENGFSSDLPLEEDSNIPIYLGYLYPYKDGYDYNRVPSRYKNGYFCVSNAKPKYEAVIIYMDRANIY